MNQKPGFFHNLAVSSKNLAKNPVSRPPNGESETGFFPQSCAFTHKLGKKPGFSAAPPQIRNRVFPTILRFHPQTRQKTRFLGHATANQKPGFFHNLAVSPTNFAKNPVSRPRNDNSETGFFRQSCGFIEKLRKKPGFSATMSRSTLSPPLLRGGWGGNI